MRKIKFLLLVALLFIVFLVWTSQKGEQKLPGKILFSSPQPSLLPSPLVVNLNSTKYNVYLQKITDSQNLQLIPNFTEQKTTQAIVAENNCLSGTNAGFYTTDHKPLGLFVTKEKSLQTTPHINALFNGYMYKTKTGKIEVADNQPDEPTDWIFQSGPLFTPERKLSIKDDKSARRILVGKTDRNDFYFLAVTESDNTNGGPILSDLPQIFQKINSEPFLNLKSQFIHLLNLDGGSASAFYSNEGVKLQELVPVGSFLCGK